MVNDLGSMDDLELMPLGGGYMVRRERLMNERPCKRSNKENGNQIKITANQLEFQRTGT